MRVITGVDLSSSATMINLTHSLPSGGALILAQTAIKLIVTKTVKGLKIQPAVPNVSERPRGPIDGFP